MTRAPAKSATADRDEVLSLAEVAAFLYCEARLLDEGAFEDWLALFDADGIYWVPAEPGQTDPVGRVSIVYEDRKLLEMRVRRLAHPSAWSLSPRPRTLHTISNIELIDAGAGEVGSALVVAEYRDGRRQTFAGRCRHHLRRGGDGLRIVCKRVDLIDCDAVHGVMSVPF